MLILSRFTMGCVTSKYSYGDNNPKIFQVMNVNEMGHLISEGHLEVTDTELILHQKSKTTRRWPLRCLRKYGCDSELFTFECGRRCPTGAGIYAFRCRRAEQLFNLLQTNLSEDGAVANDYPVPASSTGPPVPRRTPSQPESYVPSSANIRSHPTLSRPGSITSNGPITPPIVSPPASTGDTSLEHNNNKRGSLVQEHAYTNTSAIFEPESAPAYMNLNTVTSPKVVSENYVNFPEGGGHLYMNVTAGDPILTNPPKDILNQAEFEPEVEDVRHNYANINTSELDGYRRSASLDLNPLSPSAPQTPTLNPIQEVNYAELDLGPSEKIPEPLPVESPKGEKKSYATIDFNKTNALSQSINPQMDVEEGSRKTRHNSTICDPGQQRNSLSD